MNSETVELKEKYTDTIIKEIVSFLNGNGGTIYIGAKDDGTVIGVDKIDETLRKISDIITTQIEPNPQDEISSELKFDEGKVIVAITINKGKEHIYCQKKYGFFAAGCTIRIGTTCKEMTMEQIKVKYEQKFTDLEYMLKKKSSLPNLTFKELKIHYTESGYHLEDKSFEMNLNLRNDTGDYNLLAELLADKNNIPFILVKFRGENKVSISEHSDYGYGCILTTYEKIKNRLQAENICISDTTVRPREDVYLFDYDCANEAILNAIVHNDWLITEPQISMFSNRLEILSHGGLPNGMTEKQFFDGISKPRNKTLMRIVLSMGFTEHTGHGIPMIVNKYGKEAFEIESNYIRCTIPFEGNVAIYSDEQNVGNVGENINQNRVENRIIELLMENPSYTYKELSEKIGVTKRTIERTFKLMQEKGVISRIDSNRKGIWQVMKKVD